MEKRLYEHFLHSGKLSAFTTEQLNKFEFACLKSVKENPDLDFNDLLIACRIYFNFIRDFPTVDLGPIVLPKQ